MIVRETGREFFPAGPTARPYHWPVILRCTKKLLTVMRPRQLIDCTPDGEDWYANLLWLSGRKCLLLTHAATLFMALETDVRVADLHDPGPTYAEPYRDCRAVRTAVPPGNGSCRRRCSGGACA